jgi:UDP-N-acetylglucosamine 2-epimerase
MALKDSEIHVMDIIARYNFLIECRDKGLITEEKRQEIVFTFGPKSIEMIKYYEDKVEEHQLDRDEYLARLKKKSKRF